MLKSVRRASGASKGHGPGTSRFRAGYYISYCLVRSKAGEGPMQKQTEKSQGKGLKKTCGDFRA